MALETYYLATSAYAYPSSNANDGGEDNTEGNLKMITDKLTVSNFVVRRQPDQWETYFIPSYNSSPLGVKLTAGECSINGYYFNLQDTVISTTTESGTTLLKKSTEYTVALRIYKDGSGNLRGDGKSLEYPSKDQIVSRGIVAGIYSESDLSVIDPNTLLQLATFTSDNNGNPPKNPSSYILNTYRFAFIDMTMIINENGQSLEEWVSQQLNYGLSHLDKLSHWSNPNGTSPSSTLTLNDTSLIYQSGNTQFDIVAIENRTQVTVSGGRTSLRSCTTDSENPQTYNGTSKLIARGDHDHDGRYILRKVDIAGSGESSQTIHTDTLTQVSTSDKIPTFTTSRVNAESVSVNNGVTNINSSGLSTSTISASGTTTITGKLTANGGLDTKAISATSITASSTATITGKLTADGGLDTKAISATTISASGNASVGGGLTVTGNITGAKVYNAVWNDYADAVLRKEDQIIEPGDIVCKSCDSEGYELATTKNRRLVVGVCTDTYGHLLGGDEGKSLEENLEKYVPIAVAGNVRVKVQGQVFPGDLIVPSRTPGIGRAADQSVTVAPGTIVGKALEKKTSREVGRILMQVMLA